MAYTVCVVLIVFDRLLEKWSAMLSTHVAQVYVSVAVLVFRRNAVADSVVVVLLT